MEVTTLSYAKMAGISHELLWSSAAQFHCFTLKMAPFSTETEHVLRPEWEMTSSESLGEAQCLHVFLMPPAQLLLASAGL